jgi:hypothetical protein
MNKNTDQVFIDKDGKIIARGRITPSSIDLLLNDGTRYYSTFNFEAIKNLKIEGTK